MPENDPEEYDSVQEWMSYCVDDEQMRQEYPDEDKRRAVCYAMYTGGKEMALNHNSKLADDEPDWSEVDKTQLPENAFVWQAEDHESENKSTWSYPHHFVRDGEMGEDDEGNEVYTSGDMYLHESGLDAAWAAAQGARSGEEASQTIKDHLQAHREDIGAKSQPIEKVEYMRTSDSPDLEFGGKEDGPGWIEGYAAVFGNIDNYNEAIEPGAFQKTIQERVKAGKVKLMVVHFAHGGSTRDIIGTVTEAKEDEYGLWVHAEFASTDLAQDTRTQVTEGHVENLSVGYVPIDWEVETNDDGEEIIHHKEMALYDVVITAVPVNEQAVITAAKTATTAADCLQSRFIQDAKAGSGPNTLEAYRDRLKAAAKSLRNAADTLEAVGNTSDPGDTGKAVARWMSRCKRKRVELEKLLID